LLLAHYCLASFRELLFQVSYVLVKRFSKHAACFSILVAAAGFTSFAFESCYSFAVRKVYLAIFVVQIIKIKMPRVLFRIIFLSLDLGEL
jgi:hypothetical protein